MYLSQLDIRQVRNITEITLNPAKRCNLIYGPNASGKTSILESIYLLSIARSFRTTHIKHVISHNREALQVFAKIQETSSNQTTSIGLERSAKTSRIRINGADIKQVSLLSELLPVQIINPDVHKLLEQGPKFRRQFLDWGVFHVEHQFLDSWQQYYRVLKQRNAALRNKKSKKEIIVWDDQLISCAKTITLYRENYLQQLLPRFTEYVNKLMGLSVELKYQRGWNTENTYTESLKNYFDRDFARGFTSVGPHRADLDISHDNHPVQTVFSRGQQKLLVCAMRLAQVSHLKSEHNQQCILLVDDLAAELDVSHRKRLIELLIKTKAQLFITATEKNAIGVPEDIEFKMFHVEHGNLKEVL